LRTGADRQADVISLEHYYAFGGTAWLATRSALEVGYKTIRYSGREMDSSGLYYYGARYYAPWLQRWVSADPAWISTG
jgi:insecticidal toxin complex protein TccC